MQNNSKFFLIELNLWFLWPHGPKIKYMHFGLRLFIYGYSILDNFWRLSLSKLYNDQIVQNEILTNFVNHSLVQGSICKELFKKSNFRYNSRFLRPSSPKYQKD